MSALKIQISKPVRTKFIKYVVEFYTGMKNYDSVTPDEVDSALDDYLGAWEIINDHSAAPNAPYEDNKQSMFSGDSIDREMCRYIIDQKRHAGGITIDKEMKEHLWRRVGDSRYTAEYLDR